MTINTQKLSPLYQENHMTTKTEITPLPCPFCGGNNIVNSFVETYSTDSSYDVFGCDDCGARFEDGNVEMWNRRAAVEADRQDKSAKKYQIGDETYRRVFKAFGITNLSDMQAVLDAVESALVEPQQSGISGELPGAQDL